MKVFSLDHLMLTVRDIAATGPLRSVYLRDPDGNLIELSAQV